MKRQQQLIICQGIPASGKSTWAKLYAEESPLIRVRINRDDIRNMLGKYWVPEREPLVSLIEISCVEEALEEGFDVILDSTNLNKKFLKQWKEIAELYNIQILYKPFYISLEKAIKRDSERENGVGEEVIRKFYNKYHKKF